MNRINFCILMLFFLTGCCLNEPYQDKNSGEIIKSFNIHGLDIINCLIDKNEDIIIRNMNDYKELISELLKCDYNLGKDSLLFKSDTIDLSKFSIMGKGVVFNGCNGYFERNVSFDNVRKMVKYEINPKTCGNCNDKSGNMNLVVIPKIPEDYEVFITVKR